MIDSFTKSTNLHYVDKVHFDKNRIFFICTKYVGDKFIPVLQCYNNDYQLLWEKECIIPYSDKDLDFIDFDDNFAVLAVDQDLFKVLVKNKSTGSDISSFKFDTLHLRYHPFDHIYPYSFKKYSENTVFFFKTDIKKPDPYESMNIFSGYYAYFLDIRNNRLTSVKIDFPANFNLPFAVGISGKHIKFCNYNKILIYESL